MSEPSETTGLNPRKRPRWIAAGFLAAFAASVFTVIYTGLNVEGRQGEFDAGFRSVTIEPGEVRTVDLMFEVETSTAAVHLEITLPPMVALADSAAIPGFSEPLDIAAGEHVVPVAIRGLEPGSGYLVARLVAAEPVALHRVFVTVAEAAPEAAQ